MSFFDYTFPSNDVISTGKLDSDPFNYDHQALETVDLEAVDSSFCDLLGMSEKSYNLEDMLMQSKVEAVPSDYLTQTIAADYGKHQMFKKEPYNELEESELCLPSTITDVSDYASMMELNSYEASSPAGRSTTSSTGTHRQMKLKTGKHIDKASDEYRRRRELNNIAVKKSREKAKAESKMIAQRVTVLSADKERLERRVEVLNREVQILHGLFAKMSNIPESVRDEVARSVARLRVPPRS